MNRIFDILNNKCISKTIEQEIPLFKEKLIKYRVGLKWGLKDYYNNTILNPKYDSIHNFSYDVAIIKNNNKYGLVDNKGKIITFGYDLLKADYTDYLGFKYKVKKKGKYGFINNKGEIFIPLKYDYISSFYSNNNCIVKLNNKWGVIDEKNRVVIPIIYNRLSLNGLNYFCVLNHKQSIIDSEGNKLSKYYDFIDINSLNHNYRIVRLNGKYGIIDFQGEESYKPKYDNILRENSYSGTILGAYIDNIFYFINLDSDINKDIEYENEIRNEYGLVYYNKYKNTYMIYVTNNYIKDFVGTLNQFELFIYNMYNGRSHKDAMYKYYIDLINKIKKEND